MNMLGRKPVLTLLKHQALPDGWIYALRTRNGYVIEVKEHVGRGEDAEGKRAWDIYISCMSGCPVACSFCATGKMQPCHVLSASEMSAQIDYVRQQKDSDFLAGHTMRICFLAMGEPFLNVEQVRDFIESVQIRYPGTEVLLATIGVNPSDFSWIAPPLKLLLSVHSLYDETRWKLIPYDDLMTMDQLSNVRIPDGSKVIVDLALVTEHFDTGRAMALFPSAYFEFKYSLITPI